MACKLAIFDFDGTLADSFPLFVESLNVLADLHHFRRIAPTDLAALRRKSAREALREVGLPLWKTPAVARSFTRLMAERIDRVPLFPDVSAMLTSLSRHGVTLGLATSNSRDNVRRILGPANMDQIAHVQCGVSLFGKAARLTKILRAAGLPASDAIYIGDELRDGDAARAVQMAFGAVTWGYTPADILEAHAPDVLFTRMQDIASALVA